MRVVTIDIDKLLEATSELTAEKNINNSRKVEIDELLDYTRNW